jgi:hypothetical protein
MGAAFEPLPALEIAVRGRGAAFFRQQLVGVHGQAHRAARLAPFESGLDEDLVQPLGFGLLLHDARARHDHRREIAVDRLALDHLGRRAQILDAAVGFFRSSESASS